MEYFSLIGTIFLTHLLAVASPGPDFFVTIKNSIQYSRKTGVFTAFGFGLGISVHIFYCAIGLAFVISKSIFLFTTIKLLGALYLAYIGLNSLISKKKTFNLQDKEKKIDIPALKAIRIGFLTNLLNPKVTLFFLSLFTFAIKPSTPKWVILFIGILIVSSTILWFSLISLFFTQKKIQEKYYQFQLIFNKVFGILLIVISVKIAFFSPLPL